MVGKSKSIANQSKSTLSPLFNAEVGFLKRKNHDLAKTLAEVQCKCQRIEKDKELLNQELVQEKSDRISYRNKLDHVNAVLKEAVTHMFHLSNLFTTTMERINRPNNGDFMGNARKNSSILSDKPGPSLADEMPLSDVEIPSISFEKMNRSLSLRNISLPITSIGAIEEDDDMEDTVESFKENSQNFSNHKSSYRGLSMVQEERETPDTSAASCNITNQPRASSVSRTPKGAVPKQKAPISTVTPTTLPPHVPEECQVLQETTTLNLPVPNYFITRRRTRNSSKENCPPDLQASPNLSAISSLINEKPPENETSVEEPSESTPTPTPFKTHFTSTPLQEDNNQSSLNQTSIQNSSSLVLPTPKKFLFVTKRSGEANKKQQETLKTPRVVLERINLRSQSRSPPKTSRSLAKANISPLKTNRSPSKANRSPLKTNKTPLRLSRRTTRVKSEKYDEVMVKLERTSPRRKRTAAATVKSYAEPSLIKKLRRS